MFVEVYSSVNTDTLANKYFLTKEILSHIQDNPSTWELFFHYWIISKASLLYCLHFSLNLAYIVSQEELSTCSGKHSLFYFECFYLDFSGIIIKRTEMFVISPSSLNAFPKELRNLRHYIYKCVNRSKIYNFKRVVF